MEKIEWITKRVKVSELKNWENNPRTLDEKGFEDIKNSFAEDGDWGVIVCDADFTVVSGNQRLRVLVDKKEEFADVKQASRKLTEKERRRIALRANRTKGKDDWDVLANWDKEDLMAGWMNLDEIDKMLSVEEDGFDAEEEYAKIEEATTKLGDMYQLGSHRLLCGDSTSPEAVSRVMNGELANMVFTDPPYNVNYNYAKYKAIHKDRKRKFSGGGKIFNDKQKPEDFYNFLLKVFKNCYDFSKDSAGMYVCHSTSTQEQFFKAYKDAGYHFSQTIIWLKERIILGMGQDYHRVYEPILYGWKEGKKRYSNKTIQKEKEEWDLDKLTFEERLDVWYLHRDKSSEYIHPTQKPIRLSERALKKNSEIGGVLFEPFNGSGSTMMACEQSQRKCYAIELDPKYADVAVKRWELFTGKKATKVV